MDLIGINVRHKSIGLGTVVEQTEKLVTVDFQDRKCQFLFPDAFENFLKFEDSNLQDEVLKLIAEKKVKKFEERIKKEEAQSQIVLPKKVSKLKNKNTASKCNIAFKCNFCDGGADDKNIGYKSVCSDEVINYNINVAHHNWCCSDMSPCKQYHDGKITREELENQVSILGDKNVCYESQILKNWAMYAGFALTKQNKQKPMKLSQVQVNSLAILTTRSPFTDEEERFIFGVFLADKAYDGDDVEEGFVACATKYKMSLTKEESDRVLFWNYYHNDNAPDKIMWGQGLHRYLTNEQAVNILKAIADVKKGSDDEELAQEFLEHFCKINRIDF